MHKIIVCDDNVEFMEALVRLLTQYASLYNAEVIGFSTGNEVLEYCRDNQCDIIYMDIEVGEANGMSIAKTLKRMYSQLLVIYISAYDNYYTEMVQAEPFRFIPKDMLDMRKFEKAVVDTLEIAMSRITGNNLWTYEFRRRQYVIELGQVHYFRSFARTIYIVGDIGDTPGYYYGKMNDLERELEKSKVHFARINRSYIVNMKYIRYSGSDSVQVGKEKLIVAAKYRESFRLKYMEYWENKLYNNT